MDDRTLCNRVSVFRWTCYKIRCPEFVLEDARLVGETSIAGRETKQTSIGMTADEALDGTNEICEKMAQLAGSTWIFLDQLEQLVTYN